MVKNEKSTRGIDSQGHVRFPYGFWDGVHESMKSVHGHDRSGGAWRRLYANLQTTRTRKKDVDIKALELGILKHQGPGNEIPWKKISEDPTLSTLFGLNPRVLGDAWASEERQRDRRRPDNEDASRLSSIKRARI